LPLRTSGGNSCAAQAFMGGCRRLFSEKYI